MSGITRGEKTLRIAFTTCALLLLLALLLLWLKGDLYERLSQKVIFDYSGQMLDTLPPAESLAEVTHLDLSDNLLTSVETLKELETLRELDLSANFLLEIAPLTRLPQLRSLDLRHSDSIADLQLLLNMEKLTSLRLCSRTLGSWPRGKGGYRSNDVLLEELRAALPRCDIQLDNEGCSDHCEGNLPRRTWKLERYFPRQPFYIPQLEEEPQPPASLVGFTERADDDSGWLIGYKNQQGEVVLPPSLPLGSWDHHNYDFFEGLAVAWDADLQRYGYINEELEWVLPPRYTWATRFSQGLAGVILVDEDGSEASGYIDSSGEFVVQGPFIAWGIFQNGLAPVILNSTQPSPRTGGPSYMGDDFAYRLSYIDRQGNLVLREHTYLGMVAVVYPQERMGYRNGAIAAFPTEDTVFPLDVVNIHGQHLDIVRDCGALKTYEERYLGVRNIGLDGLPCVGCASDRERYLRRFSALWLGADRSARLLGVDENFHWAVVADHHATTEIIMLQGDRGTEYYLQAFFTIWPQPLED